MELIQHFHIHTRPVVKPFRKSAAYYFHQIRISRIVFRQQYQMIIPVFSAIQFLVKSGIGRNVNLTAHNGIDSGRFRLLIEINHTVHNAVIRDGCAVHPQFFHPLHILFYLITAIQQAVLRMHMQMSKCHTPHSFYTNAIPYATAHFLFFPSGLRKVPKCHSLKPQPSHPVFCPDL